MRLEGRVADATRRRGRARRGGPRRTGASGRRRRRSRPRRRRGPRRSAARRRARRQRAADDRDVPAVRGQLVGERTGDVRGAAAREEHEGADAHAPHGCSARVCTPGRARDAGGSARSEGQRRARRRPGARRRGARAARCAAARRQTSEVEPPPSRFSAWTAPSATSASASSPSVRPASSSARPSQATASRRPSRAMPERGARVAPDGDVGVELARRRPRSPRRRRRTTRAAVGPAAARPGAGRRRGPAGSASRRAIVTRAPATCRQARTSPHGASKATGGARCPPVRSSPSGGRRARTKKPPTSASADPVVGAPGRERRRAREAQDARRRRRSVVGGDVEGRRGAVGEPQTVALGGGAGVHRGQSGGRRQGSSEGERVMALWLRVDGRRKTVSDVDIVRRDVRRTPRGHCRPIRVGGRCLRRAEHLALGAVAADAHRAPLPGAVARGVVEGPAAVRRAGTP